jgi:hypothetical protein
MNRSASQLLAPASFWLALACGGHTPPTIDQRVTIQQGIYGQITSSNDVGPPERQHVGEFQVNVYDVPSGTVLGAPTASTVSDDSLGFYEISLPKGDHVVCTSFQRCVLVTVFDGQRLRLDYEISVGPGWSRGAPWPP